MNLTRSVAYAVGILLRLDELEGGPATAARIARGCRFPPRYLYRVLRRLVSARLLRGTSGPGGGYALARPLRRITLWDVVLAAEGPAVERPLQPVTVRQSRAIARINALARRRAVWTRRELRRVRLDALARAT
jgi:Rrf2 family protein